MKRACLLNTNEHEQSQASYSQPLKTNFVRTKHVIIFSINLLIALTIYSCQRVAGVNSEINRIVNNPDSTPMNDKILIVYFSRAGENYAVGHISIGNTAIIAGYIQDYTGGTIFEIVPAVPYPDSYEEMKKVSMKETDINARPAIKNPLENLDQYSIVFVGSPIWYGGPPMIMRTFYETYRDQLAGKIIVPFGTHEGSGVSGCTELVKEYFPDVRLMETLGIRGQDVKKSRGIVEAWLIRIGMLKQKQ